MSTLSAEERATTFVQHRSNAMAERETIGAIEVVHSFVEAPGSVFPLRWHVVEAGDAKAEVIALVHGHPFSWRYWLPLIHALGAKYRILAIDQKGYGQSDKRAGDWRLDRVAEELLALIDTLGVERFNLIAADRGTAWCDHLASARCSRVSRYIRLGAPDETELEGDSDYEAWHREPLWACDMLTDASRYFVGVIEPQFHVKLPDSDWMKIVAEFSHPEIGSAVPRLFQQSSFKKDLDDRRDSLFPSFRMPVLNIRGGKPTRYVPIIKGASAARPSNWHEETIEKAGIYVMLDAVPEAIAGIEKFLVQPALAPGAKKIDKASPEFLPSPAILPQGVSLVVNHDGEVEMLGDVRVVHHFAEAPGAVGPIRWHYTEAGDPKNETIIYLHGHPESWYGGRYQIMHFADRYRVIAPDLKGYGQSDKRPGDFRHESVSNELLALFDQLGVSRFSLIAHDRGAVQADYISGNHPERVIRYVRMQQIGHLLLPTNSPQERLFRDPIAGPKLFSNPKAIYDRQWQRFKMKPISQEHLNRMISEVGHPGFSDAVPRYFQSSSFQLELHDRTVRLFRRMNFPVLILQAGEDVGQPRWYYDDPKRPLTALLPNARVEWIEDAGHFTTINVPERLTAAIARFFAETH
jgi:pimeloyl-ACP methyl ester carboxylesterase